ncbi:MAG: tetratricopeptide repeat protein [Armatimonadota bacterium]
MLLVCASVACAGEKQVSAPEEFLEGWRQAAAPAQQTEEKGAFTARQEALVAAIPHFEAAVAADPGEISYRVGLGYAYLAAGKYQQAKEAIDAAVQRSRSDPLLYLLRAQAEAALAYMNPERKAEEIGAALRSFDDAAHLDPANSLSLIQAASVAFEVGKREVGLAKLEAGLARPEMKLYRLPIPEGLNESAAVSIRMWQYLQFWQWGEMLARCQNAARMALKYGKEKEEAGDLAGAEAAYKQALAIGRQVGNARPNLYITVSIAFNLMEDAYMNLARVADAQKSPEAEAWKGEAGVVSIGRQELFGKLQGYVKRLEEAPPLSVEADLALEAEDVSRPMLGVGLSPTYRAPRPSGSGEAGKSETPQESAGG